MAKIIRKHFKINIKSWKTASQTQHQIHLLLTFFTISSYTIYYSLLTFYIYICTIWQTIKMTSTFCGSRHGPLLHAVQYAHMGAPHVAASPRGPKIWKSMNIWKQEIWKYEKLFFPFVWKILRKALLGIADSFVEWCWIWGRILSFEFVCFLSLFICFVSVCLLC